MKKRSIVLILASWATFFAGAVVQKDDNLVEVNIIVHGICNIQSHFNIPAIINFLKDTVEGTYYYYNTQLYRQEPYFYQFQAMQGVGLHQITDHEIKPGNTCGALHHVLQSTFSLISHEKAAKQQYYTYGWSGVHSVKEYCAVGKQLYTDVIALKKELVQKGYKPLIRIWGYSHGGNVSLMMGHHYRSKQADKIDELILLGTPFISGATVNFIASPLFKTVYNVYSLSDKVQRYDLIHPQAFMCEQKLTKKSLKLMPKNLIQVRLKYTLPSRHTQKTKKSFAYSQDYSKWSIIAGRSSLLKNLSPGHLELWLFGWTFDNYRSDYITYPIPAAALSIPYMLHYISTIDKKFFNPAEEFIIDVRPLHEVVLINQKVKKCGTVCRAVVPFFDKTTFNDLKNTVLLYNPLDFTYERYIQQLALVDQKTAELLNSRSVQVT
jgi:hypothetical protein